MRVPDRLTPLLDLGVIDEVIRPLMSGKEAEVFLVMIRGEYRVAKVYKDAKNRSFKHRSQYTEGRKVRNSRQQRAMDKRSKYGRAEVEAAWRSAEVDAIFRLHANGVRVPTPYDFVEGVLVMELVGDDHGNPAPRLVDLELTSEEALVIFDQVLRETVKMLCAGLVHGDLSDFNVLLGPDGPVIIDFPQAVDAAGNRNAKELLLRDVRNLTQFLARFAPELAKRQYGEEMWALYESSELTPESPLTGRYRKKKKPATDTMSLLEEIEHAERENRAKREALGLPPRRAARQPTISNRPSPKPIGFKPEPKRPDPRPAKPVEGSEDRPKKRRRRRKKQGDKPKEIGSLSDLDQFLLFDD